MRSSLYKNVLVALALVLLTGATAMNADMASTNVVIIGGPDLYTATSGDYMSANVFGYTGGGMLLVEPPVTGYNFTAMSLAAVSDASLAPFDTAVLNMASYETMCNAALLGSGPGSHAQALVDFLGSGKKLILYDSECYPGPVDYSWLPYPFTTAKPGAMGAPGTLTIVEENTLSSNDPANPYYVDAAYLSSYTDAVGDMNVMTTYDSHWYVDMAGTNYLGVSGPVHTYARYGTPGQVGLIIYNGLDQDYQYIADVELTKIWRFELGQSFNPDGLPAEVPVTGIAISPETASNVIGDPHTVTATVTDLFGAPVEGVKVTFQFICGGVLCGGGGIVTTDAAGQASFTWTSTTVGTETIRASFTPDGATTPLYADATKEWTEPPIVYDFEGFFAPVDNPDCENVVKAGQAVPLKWRVTMDGVPVDDPAHFVGISVESRACDTSAPPRTFSKKWRPDLPDCSTTAMATGSTTGRRRRATRIRARRSS